MRSIFHVVCTSDSLPRRKGNKDRKKASTVPPTSYLSPANAQQSISESESMPLQDFQLIQPKIEPMSPELEFNESVNALTNFTDQKLESGATVESEIDSSSLKPSVPPPLSQGTYSNFFSLLRDLICESHSSKITTVKVSNEVQIALVH